MTVTNIQNIGRNRYKVFSDEGFLFVLYAKELSYYNIEVGSDISEAVYDEIREEVLTGRAKLRAMNLLMKHAFSEKGLYVKLVDGGYPEDIAAKAVGYVKSFGYVDDEAFAYDYVTSHADDKSIRRITQDLINKGISGEVIDKAFAKASDSEEGVDEETQIRALLAKRNFDPADADLNMINKTYKFLLGKGYSSEMIRRVLSVSAFETE